MKMTDETQQAIDFAGAFAAPQWGDEASAAVKILCRIGNDFTGDDVWRLLARVEATTPEPRALGSIIQQFAREGYIKPAGYYRKSTRRESHSRPLAVWRPVVRSTKEYDGDY